MRTVDINLAMSWGGKSLASVKKKEEKKENLGRVQNDIHTGEHGSLSALICKQTSKCGGWNPHNLADYAAAVLVVSFA